MRSKPSHTIARSHECVSQHGTHCAVSHVGKGDTAHGERPTLPMVSVHGNARFTRVSLHARLAARVLTDPRPSCFLFG